MVKTIEKGACKLASKIRNNKIHFGILLAFILGFQFNSNAQYNVIQGTDNVPITQLNMTRNGTVVVQNSGNLSTIATTDAILLDSVIINDGGTSVTLDNFMSDGSYIANNNFSSSVTGVGVYNQGTETFASNSAAWEAEMEEVVSDANLLHYLFYDGSSNTPSGADFDVRWARGLTNDEYIVVSERDGNTYFTITPLGSDGNVISGARSLRFGYQTGTTSSNGNNRYDWNFRYSSAGRSGTQPQYMSVIDVSLFNTSQTIFGLRIDNNGDADVKFYGMSPDSTTDNPINPKVPGIIGNIFNDADGLKDNTVDGSAIQLASSTQLYASLLNSSGSVIGTVPVNASGEYAFLNIDSGSYSVVLHTTSTGSSTASLPTNWMNTGENDGPGAGNDGTANGLISSISVTDSVESNINFGINKLPESVDKFFFLTSSPVLNDTRDLTSSFGMGPLSGSDLEDGAYGSGDRFVIEDTLGLKGNILFYDADNDGVFDSGEELLPGDTVNNYDPNKLSIKFTAQGTVDFKFKYAWIDAAGQVDATPATYTATWTTPVPVELVSFRVKSVANDAVLNWVTASELNNERFDIYRSVDNGITFEKLGGVSGNGTTHEIQNYSFVDYGMSSTLITKACYKLKQIDFDGNFEWSDVTCIVNSHSNDVVVYPNPATSVISVSTSNQEEIGVVQLLSVEGKELESRQMNNNAECTIDIRNIQNGVYFIKVTQGDVVTISRVVIGH